MCSSDLRSTYADLFSAIATTYGAGDGSTTFNLPDLRGRSVFGKDDMGGTAANRVTSAGSSITGTTLGASGGAQNVTLTEAQIPAHTHTVSVQASQSPFSDTSGSYVLSGGSTTTSSTGGGQSHTNMPPTMIMNYIIKI